MMDENEGCGHTVSQRECVLRYLCAYKYLMR
jgi:hypothetical protein